MENTLTVDEVARLLRVSRESVRRRIHAGALRAVRQGHAWRIPAEALDGLGPAVFSPATLSIAEAARSLGVCKTSVLKRIRIGSLPATREQGRWRIPAAGLDAAIDVAIMETPHLLTQAEAARALGVSRQRVGQMVARGALATEMHRTRRMVTKESVENYGGR